MQQSCTSQDTHIIVVLDRSGSMQTIKQDMEGALNTFLSEQRKLDGRCWLTYITFNDVVETVWARKRLEDISCFALEPDGMTALHDGIGAALDNYGCPRGRIGERTIMVIVTDGGENASRRWTLDKVASRLRHQQDKHDWTIMYLGANVDSFAVGRSLNIEPKFISNYVYNRRGAAAASAGINYMVSNARAGNDLRSATVKDLTAVVDSETANGTP